MSDTSPSAADERRRRAEDLLADWLTRSDGPTPQDAAGLLDRHPDLADVLAPLLSDLALLGARREQLDLGAVDGDAAALRSLARQVHSRREDLLATRAAAWPYDPREQRLSGGQLGIVSRGHEWVTGREVVLKRPRPAPASSGDAERLDLERQLRLFREARLLGRLNHPSIVPLVELTLDPDDVPVLVMGLVEGQDLTEAIASSREPDSPWPLPKLVGALAQACEAMAHAHGRQVVHRDLKPDNIRLRPDGSTVVIDWGLARDMTLQGEQRPLGDEPPSAPGDTPATPSRDGLGLGSPAYASPEQRAGRWDLVDARADVYSLGATLLHALAGAPPAFVGGDEPASRQRREQQLQNAPPALASIALKATAIEPAERYTDATAMAADLAAFLERRVVAAYASGPWAELKAFVRRNAWLAASLLALLVLVGIVLQEWGAIAVMKGNLHRLQSQQEQLRIGTDQLHQQTEQLRGNLTSSRSELASTEQRLAAARAELRAVRDQLEPSDVLALLDGLPLTDVDVARLALTATLDARGPAAASELLITLDTTKPGLKVPAAIVDSMSGRVASARDRALEALSLGVEGGISATDVAMAVALTTDTGGQHIAALDHVLELDPSQPLARIHRALYAAHMGDADLVTRHVAALSGRRHRLAQVLEVLVDGILLDQWEALESLDALPPGTVPEAARQAAGHHLRVVAYVADVLQQRPRLTGAGATGAVPDPVGGRIAHAKAASLAASSQGAGFLPAPLGAQLVQLVEAAAVLDRANDLSPTAWERIPEALERVERARMQLPTATTELFTASLSALRVRIPHEPLMQSFGAEPLALQDEVALLSDARDRLFPLLGSSSLATYQHHALDDWLLTALVPLLEREQALGGISGASDQAFEYAALHLIGAEVQDASRLHTLLEGFHLLRNPVGAAVALRFHGDLLPEYDRIVRRVQTLAAMEAPVAALLELHSHPHADESGFQHQYQDLLGELLPRAEDGALAALSILASAPATDSDEDG